MAENDELDNIRIAIRFWRANLRVGIELQLKATGQRIEAYAGKTKKEYIAWLRGLNTFEKPIAPASEAAFRDELPSIGKYSARVAFLLHHFAGASLSSGQLPKAIDELVHAEMSLRLSVKTTHRGITLKEARGTLAQIGAQAKLACDPRQVAKQFVKQCWQTWQEEPERYKSKAAFARDMLLQDQCKSLKSQVKITDWCRAWERSHPAG